MTVENSKGECNFGQHEINFRYDDALQTADDHVIYKTGAKEIAAQEGMSITYMAKFDEREGNSCHIHLSIAEGRRRERLRGRRGDLRPLRGGAARRAARAHADVRPARELVQALRGRLVRADRGGVGPRQPHLLDAGGGARPGVARGEPAPRRGREPVPRAGGDDRRRAARRRQRAGARAGVRGQRLRVRQAAGAAQHVRRARPVRGLRDRARGVRRRRWSTTT